MNNKDCKDLVKNQLKIDLKSCKFEIKFWNRVYKNYDDFNDLITKSEIKDLLNYYKDMKDFLEKDLEDYE